MDKTGGLNRKYNAIKSVLRTGLHASYTAIWKSEGRYVKYPYGLRAGHFILFGK